MADMGGPGHVDTKDRQRGVYEACGGRRHGLRFPCARRWRHRPVQTARKRHSGGFSRAAWALGHIRRHGRSEAVSGPYGGHGGMAAVRAALETSFEARFCRRRLRKWPRRRFSAFPVKSPFHRKIYGETSNLSENLQSGRKEPKTGTEAPPFTFPSQ